MVAYLLDHSTKIKNQRAEFMINPKHEIRNSKQIQSTNDQNLSSKEVKFKAK